MSVQYKPEWHPWLKMLTVLGIIGGFILLIPCIVFIGNNSYFFDPSTGSNFIYLTLFFGVFSFIGIFGGFYTLKTTDYFRKWKLGVPFSKKILALFVMEVGLSLFLALFLITPFLRFLTDSVGGGISSIGQK